MWLLWSNQDVSHILKEEFVSWPLKKRVWTLNHSLHTRAGVDTNDNNPLKNSILDLRTVCSVNSLASSVCLKSSHYSMSYYSGLWVTWQWEYSTGRLLRQMKLCEDLAREGKSPAFLSLGCQLQCPRVPVSTSLSPTTDLDSRRSVLICLRMSLIRTIKKRVK